MGGRFWSADEERVFWLQIMPFSPKRIGIHELNAEQSWDVLAIRMQELMGDKARRQYSGLGLFEHYFLNVVKEQISPNSCGHAQRHIRKMDELGIDRKIDGFRKPRDGVKKPRKTPVKRPAARPARPANRSGPGSGRAGVEPGPTLPPIAPAAKLEPDAAAAGPNISLPAISQSASDALSMATANEPGQPGQPNQPTQPKTETGQHYHGNQYSGAQYLSGQFSGFGSSYGTPGNNRGGTGYAPQNAMGNHQYNNSYGFQNAQGPNQAGTSNSFYDLGYRPTDHAASAPPYPQGAYNQQAAFQPPQHPLAAGQMYQSAQQTTQPRYPRPTAGGWNNQQSMVGNHQTTYHSGAAMAQNTSQITQWAVAAPSVPTGTNQPSAPAAAASTGIDTPQLARRTAGLSIRQSPAATHNHNHQSIPGPLAHPQPMRSNRLAGLAAAAATAAEELDRDQDRGRQWTAINQVNDNEGQQEEDEEDDGDSLFVGDGAGEAT
ncbi:hypothetical protein QBC47DRAFT_396877 [Echria macrotheca]|uniref:Uncharacterized protein n=1 Tax=Echria macrotheca TaxID=438768 RepID=A0AAJ0BMA7_9PEZI|nr:hypothetical protein QBC47DRAFT_396877 [Echria macrotheca]